MGETSARRFSGVAVVWLTAPPPPCHSEVSLWWTGYSPAPSWPMVTHIPNQSFTSKCYGHRLSKLEPKDLVAMRTGYLIPLFKGQNFPPEKIPLHLEASAWCHHRYELFKRGRFLKVHSAFCNIHFRNEISLNHTLTCFLKWKKCWVSREFIITFIIETVCLADELFYFASDFTGI